MSLAWRLALVCLMGPSALVAMDAERDWLDLSSSKEAGGIAYRAANEHAWMPLHLTLSMPLLDNMVPSQPLPLHEVLLPHERRVVLRLAPKDPSRNSDCRVQTRYGLGDPRLAPDGSLYHWPWEHGKEHRITQGYYGSFSHRDEQALDFDLVEGEAILAARAGLVVEAKDSASQGGLDPSFASKGNEVMVLHADGTWAVYAHLQKGGARVHAGQQVKAGDRIGLAGHTGQAQGPHLHFAVFRALWDEPGSATIATQFIGAGGRAEEPKEGSWHFAYQEGGADFSERHSGDRSLAQMQAWDAPAAPAKEPKLRSEHLENRTWVFLSNGTRKDLWASVSFSKLDGASSTPPAPVAKVVKAGREAFMLWVDETGSGQARWQLSYRWKAAGGVSSPEN